MTFEQPRASEPSRASEQPQVSEQPRAAKPPRPARPLFGTSVLWLEVLLVLFIALAAFGLRVADPGLIVGASVVMTVLCAIAARLQHSTIGVVLGSLAQVLFLLGGFVIGAMWIIGGIFIAVWITAMVLGTRIDRERAQRLTAQPS